MSTENQSTPVVEGEALPEQAVPAETPESAPEPQDDPRDKTIKRLERRIHRLTARVYEERGRQSQPQPERVERAEPEGVDPAEVQRLIDLEAQRKAQELVEKRFITERADSLEKSLQKTLGDRYAEFYAELQSSGQQGAALLRAAIELEDAADVLSELAQDPDEFDRVLEMTPTRQAAYLGRVSARLEAKKTAPKVSQAPKPLAPIKPNASSDELTPDMPIDDWMKKREEQLRARRRL